VCQSCEARHRGICGALDESQLLEFSRYTHQRALTKSTEFLREDDRIEHFANVMSGVIKLTKLLDDGREQIVGLQFAPDFVGEISSDESSVTAIAATQASVCAIPKSAITRLIDASPDVGRRLYRQSQRELEDARAWLLALGRKTAIEKVASLLHYIALNIDPTRSDEETEITFELPLTRSEMADFLGLTTETVSRQMTKLRGLGLLEIQNSRTVFVPDLDALSEVGGS